MEKCTLLLHFIIFGHQVPQPMHKIDFLSPVPIQDKVRIGSNYDGGYVVYNKVLADTDVLLNYGVGWETSFEEHFNELTGGSVLMFDPTLFGRYIVDYPYMFKHLLGLRFKRIYKHIAKRRFWSKKFKQLESKNIRYIQEGIATTKSNKYDTLASHIERFQLQDKQIFLKIDIEGGEFEIFEDAEIYKSLWHVNQMVLEFHDLNTRLHDVQRIMRRLSDDFELVHIHGNNYGPAFLIFDLLNEGKDNVVMPEAIEVTLVRKDKLDPADVLSKQWDYPTPGLDYPNNPDKEDYLLKFV
jgi:hypothetical protein